MYDGGLAGTYLDEVGGRMHLSASSNLLKSPPRSSLARYSRRIDLATVLNLVLYARHPRRILATSDVPVRSSLDSSATGGSEESYETVLSATSNTLSYKTALSADDDSRSYTTADSAESDTASYVTIRPTGLLAALTFADTFARK